jgi:hypothetical protein
MKDYLLFSFMSFRYADVDMAAIGPPTPEVLPGRGKPQET